MNQKLDTSKTSWDLTPLYSSDDDPRMQQDRQKIEEANYAFINKWKNRDDYLTDPAVLQEALDELEKIDRSWGNSGKEGYYFGLRLSIDQSNTDLKAKDAQISDFAKKIYNDFQFFLLKVAKIDQALQPRFLEYPGLAPYKHFLERQFATASHNLSEAEEKILVLVSKPAFGNWVDMTEEFLSREEREVATKDGKQTKNLEELMGLFDSQDKSTRDSAAAAFNDILSTHVESATHELNSVLEYKKINDELRGFIRPDESRLLDDDIETGVVDALLAAVENRRDISKRFYQLKAQLLGVPKLAYHERNIPIATEEKKYNFEDSAALVYEVLSALDPEFGEIFKNFIERGNIDVYPKKGKRNGAFCIHDLITQPTYILLNHNDVLGDVRTLAHETGHGINNELMKKTQNSINFGVYKSTAEVASTFMEDFVTERLLKDATDEERLGLQMQKLNNDVSSIIRQISFYRFEQDLHSRYREKGYLSKEDIGNLFQTHMAGYMGDFVEQSAGSENWWVYVGHFRMMFYVFSYASGLLISKSLQASVRKDPKFISNVKEFLSAGLSDSPKNIFAKMDIDITDKKFWENGLDEIDHLLNETETLAKKLGKIK